jgi:hypothetical protein
MNHEAFDVVKPKNEIEAEPMKPRTDWIAWSLHLIFGIFAGSGVGFLVARMLFRFYLTGFDAMLLVVAGFSLCCGAFTSFHGNLAWMMPSVFTPSQPPQTRKPRNCSIIIGTIGAALILLPIILHVINFGLPAHKSAMTGAEIFVVQDGRLQLDPESHKSTALGVKSFLLLLAALPGFLLVRALRTGSGYWRFGTVDRNDTPLNFWIYVILNAVVVVCILSAIV